MRASLRTGVCTLSVCLLSILPSVSFAQTDAPTTYNAATDLTPRPKPALPALGPAGYGFDDPTFGTPIWRVTDAMTRPGYPNKQFHTASSPHQNEWSANGSYFYVTSSGGTVIPFAFDAATGTASRLKPATTGDGGLILQFYIEPQFSYVSDNLIYGSYNGSGSTRRTIDQYDFGTGAYTGLLDLDQIETGLSGTYIGGIASSAGPVERVVAFFGGTGQDYHYYVVVFDRSNPAERHVMNTVASTVDGHALATTLNFHLHHVNIDRSGRYVLLYPTATDQASPRYAAPIYVWDLSTNVVTELPKLAAHSAGHDAYGYGTLVNKDCCTTSSWDAGQWQFRSLATPLVTQDLISPILTPKETYMSDHTSWNNARSDVSVPVISATYRYGTVTSEWRAWDDEVIAIQTDVLPGTGATVWRFAHHRSNVADDLDATKTWFWYQPLENVSHDGRWVLFSSNWEKTLGTDPTAASGGQARTDVFVLRLDAAQAPQPLPPGTPTAPSPADGATGISTSPTLTWTSDGATTYDVSFGVTNPPPQAAAGLPNASYSPPALSSGNTYFWQIVAHNSAGATAGPVWSFTTAAAVAPATIDIATTSLPSATRKKAYSATIQANNATGAISWRVTQGSLPHGFSLNASTGVLSGTTNGVGAYTFTVTATDAVSSASQSFTLTVGK